MAPTRSRYFVNTYRRRTNPLLRRTDASPDYLETIIIHSDSSDDERRLDQEIDDIRNKMDELDEQKSRLRRDMAKKFKEREDVRVARQIRRNNLRLKREFERRLLPTIEGIAARRQDIVHGVRTLFENIDDNLNELPPSYESLFPTTPSSSTTTLGRNTTRNGDGNESDSSTVSLPSVNSIFREIIGVGDNNNNTNTSATTMTRNR